MVEEVRTVLRVRTEQDMETPRTDKAVELPVKEETEQLHRVLGFCGRPVQTA